MRCHPIIFSVVEIFYLRWISRVINCFGIIKLIYKVLIDLIKRKLLIFFKKKEKEKRIIYFVGKDFGIFKFGKKKEKGEVWEKINSNFCVMATEIEPAKLLLPYLQRADELQKHEPLVAYYCKLLHFISSLFSLINHSISVFSLGISVRFLYYMLF